MEDYIGLGQFVWFIGVVEDRQDPLRMGRVRVRVYGWHSENRLEKLKTNEIPWAQVIQAPTSAAMGDVGETPLGLVEGSWVVGFFLDGIRYQRPIVLGSFSGIPKELGSEIPFERVGFSDPNGVYPKRKNEPDVNRLARNDLNFDHPLEEGKDLSQTTKVPIANQSASWDEPPNPYAAEYPFNHVRETESGHIIELDDTTDAERVHIYHKSGTFIEMHPNGDQVTRIVGDNYEIVAGGENVNIKGQCNLTIDSDCNTYIKGNWNVQVDGNVNEVIKGTLTQNVTGAVSETYGSSQSTQVTGNIDIDGARIDLN